MAENSPKGLASGLTQTWGNPKARKGLILSALVLTIVGVVGFIGMRGTSKPTAPPANVQIDRPPGGQGDPTATNSAQYSKMARQNDAERAAAAMNDPVKSVLPSVPGLTNPATPPPPPAVNNPMQPAAPPPGATAQQAQQQQQFNAEQAARQSEAYRNSQQLMSGIVQRAMGGGGGQGGSGLTPIFAPQNQNRADGPREPAPANSGAERAQLAKAPLIRAGESLFGTIDTAINSDHAGPVVATIRQGKFAGARLIGQKELQREAVVIRFQTMSPPNGANSIGVDAYAITIADAKSFGTTGIEGDTDYHIFQRYVIPATLAFAQAFGYASSIPSQTITNGPYGQTVVQEPLTTNQKLATAAGGAMAPLLKDVERYTTRPVTVKLDANTEIGILFAADVIADNREQTRPADAAAADTRTAAPRPLPVAPVPAAAPTATPVAQAPPTPPTPAGGSVGTPGSYSQVNPYATGTQGGVIGTAQPALGLLPNPYTTTSSK